MVSDNETFSVLVINMNHNPEDEVLVDGFPTVEAARLYARRRTWSSVERVKALNPKKETAKWAYAIYGETASVLEDDYSAWSEREMFFDQTPLPEDIDWEALEEEFELTKS